jgi:phosphohistidine phosphatase
MELYLLRHGIAVVRDDLDYERDAERPLTSKGKRQLRQIADAMKTLGLRFDLILSSPYVRAQQTAEIVAKALKRQKQLKLSDELIPGGNPRALIQQLSANYPKADAVLLVGHEPYLSRLIGLLITGETHLGMDLKKGGLCKLEIEKLSYSHCATLAWLLTPKQMRLMR